MPRAGDPARDITPPVKGYGEGTVVYCEDLRGDFAKQRGERARQTC